MGDGIVILLSCLVLLSVSVEASIFPEHHEITYKYTATVKAFTNKPTRFGSAYHLTADLKTINYGNATMVSFENITYAQYLGQNFLHEVEEMEAPEIPADLRKPFVIEYDEGGRSIAILTENTDVAWSIDIKKALAYILQVDSSISNSSPLEYYVDELSMYGSCPVLYTVWPSSAGSNKFNLRKHINPTTCENFKWESSYSLEPDVCEKPYDNPLTITLDRQYEVEKMDHGKVVFNSIKSVSAITMAAFDGESDTYVIKIDQVLVQQDMKKAPVERQYVPDRMVYNKLTRVDTGETTENLYDLIGNRFVYNLNDITNIIARELHSIAEQLTGDGNVEMSDSNQKFEFLLQHLRLLNDTELMHCFQTFKSKPGKEFNFFLQLLPAIGTRGAALMIKDLIVKHLIDPKTCNGLIAQLPFYLKNPTKSLLNELMVLKTARSDIHKTSVLALATILSKVLRNHPNDSELNKFVDEYIESFKSSQNYDDHLLYLAGLKNIGTRKVNDFLEQVIKKEVVIEGVTTHLRAMAMKIISKHYIGSPKMKLYWLLLEDVTEPMEIRIFALSALLTRPTMEELLKLYVYTITNMEKTLYKLFFSTMESTANIKAPCFQTSARNAKKILQIVQEPDWVDSDSFDDTYDFFDTKYKFGMMMRIGAIGNLVRDKFTNIHVNLAPQIANFNLNQQTTYLHVTFRNYSRDADLIHDRTYNKIQLFLVLIDLGLLDFEIYNMRNDYIVSVARIAENHYVDLYDFLEQNYVYPSNTSMTYHGVGIKVDGETILPTDIGVAAKFFLQMPTAFRHTYKYNDGERINRTSIVTILYDLLQLNHQVYGMKVYNPILDIWHGTRRNHISKTVVPIDLKLSLGRDLGVLMNYPKKYIFETTTYSEVFRESVLNGTLYQQIATEGESYQKNAVLWEHNCNISNMKYRLSVKRCERPLSSSKMTSLKESFFGDDNKNWGNHPSLKVLASTRHIWAYSSVSPTLGMCTINVEAEPMYVNSTFKMTARSHNDTPNVTIAFNATTFEGRDYWWNLNIDNGGENHLKNWINATLTTQKTKLCFRRESVKSNQKIRSHFLLYGGETDQDACPRDKMTIEASGLAKYSPDQYLASEIHDYTFEKCQRHQGPDIKCMAEQAYMGKHSYDIKGKNLSPAVKQLWTDMISFLTRVYPEYDVVVADSPREQNRIKFSYDVKGVFSQEADITLETSLDTKYFRRVDIMNGPFSWLLKPNSEIVSKMDVEVRKHFQHIKRCLVKKNNINDFRRETVERQLTESWQKYLTRGECLTRCPFEVNIKQLNSTNKLVVQVIYSENVLEINPKFEITLNNIPIEGSKFGYYDIPGLAYKITKKHLFIHIFDEEVYLIHSGDSVEIYTMSYYMTSGICEQSDTSP